MSDTRWKIMSGPLSLDDVLPETLLEAEELAASIEREVQRQTGGAVRNLAVEVRCDSIRLQGRCQSYYHKQLAQQAVMGLPGDRQLHNEIEVA